MKDCEKCGRIIIESKGCVGVEVTPGVRRYYHPACVPKDARP